METPTKRPFLHPGSEKWNKVFLQILSCPICMNLYKNPRHFPHCSHSLCFDCMTKLPIVPVSSGNDSATSDILTARKEDMEMSGWVECPVCSVRSPIGPAGVSFYPVNYVAQQIIDMVGETVGFTPIRSQVCNHVVKIAGPKTECKHCGKFFCDVCKVNHADYLKQEIVSAREKWEKWHPCSEFSEAAIAEFTARMDADVAAVEEQIRSVILSAAQCVKRSLEGQGKRLSVQAEGIREQKVQAFLQRLKTNYDAMSGAARLIDDQMEAILSTPSAPVDLDTLSTLHKLVTDTINIGMTNLESMKVAPKIRLVTEPLFPKLISDFADKLEIGMLKIEEGDILHHTETLVEPELKPPPPPPTRVRRRSASFSTGDDSSQLAVTPTGAMVSHVEVPVLANCSFEHAGITEPTGIVYLPISGSLLVPDGRIWLSFVHKPFENNITQRLTVPDPDLSSSIQFIETNTRVAAYNDRIFVLDVRRRRIVSCMIGPAMISRQSVDVLARNAQFEGLAVNAQRRELYTIQNGDRFLVFSTDVLGTSPKTTCQALKRGRVLGANDTFGVVYRLPYHPSDGLTKLHCKQWPVDENPPDLCSEEVTGFDLGLPLKGSCNAVEFDSKGNMLIVDSYEATIRIYSKHGYKGKVEWRYCCFLDDSMELEHSFDPSSIAVVANRSSLIESYGAGKKTKEGEEDILVAVVDDASRNILLLRLPSA